MQKKLYYIIESRKRKGELWKKNLIIIQVTRGNKKVLKIESYRKKNEKKCIN